MENIQKRVLTNVGHSAYNIRIAGLVMAWVRNSKFQEVKRMNREQINEVIDCLNDELDYYLSLINI